jgi:hypothetical protein
MVELYRGFSEGFYDMIRYRERDSVDISFDFVGGKLSNNSKDFELSCFK